MNGGVMFYGAAIALIMGGIMIAATKRNLIKIIIGLNIMETGVNLLLIATGYISGGTAPIMNKTWTKVVDPIPQALVLTAIVIGVAVTAMALSIVVRIYEKNNSLDIRKIKEMRW